MQIAIAALVAAMIEHNQIDLAPAGKPATVELVASYPPPSTPHRMMSAHLLLPWAVRPLKLGPADSTPAQAI